MINTYTKTPNYDFSNASSDILKLIACHLKNPKDFFNFATTCKKINKALKDILNNEKFSSFKIYSDKKFMANRINELRGFDPHATTNEYGLKDTNHRGLIFNDRGLIFKAYEPVDEALKEANLAYCKYANYISEKFDIRHDKVSEIKSTIESFANEVDPSGDRATAKELATKVIDIQKGINENKKKFEDLHTELDSYVSKWEGCKPVSGPFVNPKSKLDEEFEKAITNCYNTINK